MAPIPTRPEADSSEASAAVRVESFLECVETKRRRTLRLRLAALGVGGVIATVVFLTSIGVIPEAARIVATTGALVAGLLASERSS